MKMLSLKMKTTIKTMKSHRQNDKNHHQNDADSIILNVIFFILNEQNTCKNMKNFQILKSYSIDF